MDILWVKDDGAVDSGSLSGKAEDLDEIEGWTQDGVEKLDN